MDSCTDQSRIGQSSRGLCISVQDRLLLHGPCGNLPYLSNDTLTMKSVDLSTLIVEDGPSIQFCIQVIIVESADVVYEYTERIERQEQQHESAQRQSGMISHASVG